MDEKKLDEILSKIDAPEPDNNARKEALNLARAAFDEKKSKKFAKNFKGNEKTDRPTGITHNFWRSLMDNKFKLSGLSGAVATCAICAIIGVPTYTYMMQNTGVSGDAAGVMFSKANKMTFDAPKSSEALSPAQQRARQEVNEQQLAEAMKSAESFIPVPLGEGNSDIELHADDSEHDLNKSLSAFSAAKPGDKNVNSDFDPMLSKENRAVPSKKMAPQVREQQAVASGAVMADRAIAPATPSIIMPEPMPPQEVQGQDEFEAYKDSAIKSVTAEPVSTFSIDVDTASYSFTRRMLNNGQLPPRDAVRVEELVNYFDYNYTVPDNRAEPFMPTVAVYDSPWADGKKLMHIGIKGYELPADAKPKSNLVFLIDTSGSMNARDKLPLLKTAFTMMVNNLSPDDTVAIVTYAGSAGTVLEPTKVSDSHKIVAALNNLSSGGSTAGAAGIKQAYALAESSFAKGGVNRVILATDGDFNVGMTNHDQLKDYIAEKRDTGISLSVLGFGQGNYHDNLMQTLAQNGNGNAAYIDSLNEARKVLVEEAGSTLFTIAKDVKIQVEFNPSKVSEYRLIGYETRALKREDFNNDKIDAGEVGAGHSVTAIYEITPKGSSAQLIDDLRYGEAEDRIVPQESASDEYAFLKMRYKLPVGEGLGEFSNKSTLYTRPITAKDDASIDMVSDDIRFAAAVAGFGQLLRGGQYTSADFGFDDVATLANSAKGEDQFGYRAEFINLVKLAEALKK